ncbi:MAG: DUF4139 domain-containing protein, partial [Alphaproteobacteria bacterium]|nr:DUF4139 domain-containing protein [Alphaproteobacteria bacterium]
MKKTVLLLSLTALCTANALAETEITIYNQNLALIKKSQTTDLKSGINEIIFDEVAQQMRPESAFIYGADIRVLEQNYDYAGINYSTLLQANLGKEVNTVRTNPQDGSNIFKRALLVSANQDSPLLKFDYGIETNFPGRVLFDSIPKELNSTPVLMAKIESPTAATKDLNLAYLTSGFTWQANYIAKVNNKEYLALLGRAAVTNNSGSGYNNVKVNLIAGNVNTVTQYLHHRMLKAVQTQGMLANAASFADEEAVIAAPTSLDSYYVYEIPGKTELKNGQIKQVSFITAPKVKYQKEGVINSSLSFSSTTKSAYKDVHPNIIYHFTNNKEDGLGMPLPQGKISLYAPDEKGALQFIGENMIDNKAEGQKVSLQIGKFFDVYGEGNITDISKITEKQFQKPNQKCPTIFTTYRYKATYSTKNKNKDTVHMVIKQPLHGQAKVIKETLAGTFTEGNIYEWKFDIEPGKT